MIINYSGKNKLKAEIITAKNAFLLQEAVWIDIINPSKEEENLVEEIILLDIPTREEMQEIELSSRLYKENSTLFMTVTMIAKSDSFEPSSDAVTLILKGNQLITLRYIEPQSFSLFTSRLSKLSIEKCDAPHLLIELLDVSVDRLADILEKISQGLDEYSQAIFKPGKNVTYVKPDYKSHFRKIGMSGDLSTKVQESLLTFNRLLIFLDQTDLVKNNSEIQSRLSMIGKDIDSLNDYIIFLSNKVNFLLDATLGLVNIDQNNIIKIFSIAAVILLPPTLVASIYGMNFKVIPELSWQYGYPLAIAIMFISAWIPYIYFKKKKWL